MKGEKLDKIMLILIYYSVTVSELPIPVCLNLKFTDKESSYFLSS